METAATESEAMVDEHRGSLRVYLGAAPGVGKTYAMLSEGHRRRDRGGDIVVGFVETHGRDRVEALLDGLEPVPRRTLNANDGDSGELDVEAVVDRAPSVVLIDELAHTNGPGSRHLKRWQDIEEILAAGIDVVTTMNVQHLESLNDVVESITGLRQEETVPDAVVRRADQIELVDMSPEALRRRLAHGNVYPAEKIDAALTNYFRLGNLTALRELALLWVADRVDDALEDYRSEHDIDSPWPARERVVVALTGGPEGDALIRRGARIAQRAQGGQLLALHVAPSRGLADALPTTLAHQRTLVESLSGTWHTVVGDDIASAILTFARGINASQIVLGASRRNRLSAAISPGVGPDVVRDCGEIDVHIVTHEHAGGGRTRHPGRGALTRARLLAGWTLAVVGPPLLAAGLYFHQGQQGLPNVLMLFLALTVGIALVGGLWPAIFAALFSGLLANYWFTAPLYRWTIDEPENVFAIIVLVSVAAAVSAVVDLAARRSRQAAQARTEADTLATLAGSVLQSDSAASALLEQVREMFNFSSAALLERKAAGSWAPHSHAGSNPAMSPEEADTTIPVSASMVLALRGSPISAQDLRIATAMASQTGALIERDRLRAESRNNRQERERTAIRASLLAAVSHDLRTPLAGVKASVSSLRSDLYELTPADQADLLAGIEDSADQLKALIDNLLDMSRLDSGAVVPRLAPVALDEVVPRALSAIPTERIVIDVPETLPLINADAGLLERSLANVVENAVRHAPGTAPVLVTADHAGSFLVLRVADRGPGVPENKRKDMFHAFQRVGDAPDGHGLGLGLAVARGFAEANGGTLEVEDTPGGGLTMVFTLKIVSGESA